MGQKLDIYQIDDVMTLDELDDLLEMHVALMRKMQKSHDTNESRDFQIVLTALGRVLREGRPASIDELVEVTGAPVVWATAPFSVPVDPRYLSLYRALDGAGGHFIFFAPRASGERWAV